MSLTDALLIENILDGKLEAFDELMVRYERLVYKIAYNFTKDREHALDITQAVFLKAYEKLAGVKDRNHFKAWVIRVTYNECVSWQRSQRNHDWLDEEATGLRKPNQELDITNRESREQLGGLLNRLNPKYRLAVVLKYFEGLPIREIAGVLECSEGSVKNMLYRSMRQMARS